MAAYLDELLANAQIVDAGAAPPLNAGRPPIVWGERHGHAIVWKAATHVVAADGVILPGGQIGRALAVRGPNDWWRRPLDHLDVAWTTEAANAGVRWQWGSVKVESDRLSFSDLEFPAAWPQFPPDCGELAYTILNDPVLNEAVADLTGSHTLASLVNTRSFIRRSNGLVQFLGRKWGLQLAVGMRGLGEVADDLDMATPNNDWETIDDRDAMMRERLDQLGWDEGR